MRNDQRTLTHEERIRVAVVHDRLMAAQRAGHAVTFTYTKDSGEESTRTGEVLEFAGAESKAAVKIETPEGVRTFNLRNISF